MYLSQLRLDPRHRDTRQWLSDCNLLHQAVMRAFPEATSEAARAELGVLFRVDKPRDGIIPVLVQSKVAPSWAFETRAVLGHPQTGTLDALEAMFVVGQPFQFRLRANPTRRIHRRSTQGADERELDTRGNWRAAAEIPEHQRTGVVRRTEPERYQFGPNRKSGPRVELTREEDRLAWLARRGREHDGFELLSVQLIPGFEATGIPRDSFDSRADPDSRLRSRSRRHNVTVATALFEGRLHVTDPEEFRRAFESGIGPGKAFGCGLLSLVRPT